MRKHPWVYVKAPGALRGLGFEWVIRNNDAGTENIAVDDEGLSDFIKRLLNEANFQHDLSVPMPICHECSCRLCDCGCHELDGLGR